VFKLSVAVFLGKQNIDRQIGGIPNEKDDHAPSIYGFC
jgi:hypothetical protein